MASFCGPFQSYLCIVTVLLLGVASLTTGSPPIQDANDRPRKDAQSADNSCFNYNLVDAASNAHYFYTCCGTLGDAGTADAKTKVANYDCNPPHLTTTEISHEPTLFTCSQKESSEKWCNDRWGWLSTDDCWVWSKCFEAACRPGSSEGSFCGDGRCDDSDETSNSCPLDCCPVVTDQCIIKNSTCSSPCCSEATCCAGNSASTAAADATAFWLIVGAVIAGVLCLLYCCCCCCCCCCRHLYKSMFHHSTKKRRHSSFMISGAI